MSSGSSGLLHLTTLGQRLAVTFDDTPAGTREAFAHAWSRAITEPVPDPTVVAAPPADDIAGALHQLSTVVTLAAINGGAGHLWMLHAAGLAHPGTGATVALVAPSGTGKSTAARVLGRALAYLSDETVGVAADGTVHAHPKPLSILEPHTHVKQQVSPDDAGLLPAHGSATLRAVVVLTRDSSATPWLEPIRTAAALPELASQTSYLTRLARPLSLMAGLLEHTAGAQRLHYREIEDAAPLIEGLLR